MAFFQITHNLSIPEHEIKFFAIRASGPGGQNVNKVSSAVQLRFDIRASSLPEQCRQRLLAMRDRRLTRDGVLVIKAQKFRSRMLNRQDALNRLKEFIISGIMVRTACRKSMKPTRAASRRRLDSKRRRGKLKVMRQKVRI